MTLTKLNFITGNRNKLTEVRAILGNVIEVDNQSVDVPEIQGTIEEIAKEKARRAAETVSVSRSPVFLSLITHEERTDQWPGLDRGYCAGISRS